MVVDYLRTCYETYIRPWRDRPDVVKIRWMRAPSAASNFPGRTRFASRVWSASKYAAFDSQLDAFTYKNGQNIANTTGRKFCGRAIDYQLGAESGVSALHHVNDDWTCDCCEHFNQSTPAAIKIGGKGTQFYQHPRNKTAVAVGGAAWLFVIRLPSWDWIDIFPPFIGGHSSNPNITHLSNPAAVLVGGDSLPLQAGPAGIKCGGFSIVQQANAAAVIVGGAAGFGGGAGQVDQAAAVAGGLGGFGAGAGQVDQAAAVAGGLGGFGAGAGQVDQAAAVAGGLAGFGAGAGQVDQAAAVAGGLAGFDRPAGQLQTEACALGGAGVFGRPATQMVAPDAGLGGAAAFGQPAGNQIAAAGISMGGESPMGSTLPVWVKVTKTYSDFSSASSPKTIDLYAMPANGVLHSVIAKHSASFTGGSVLAASMAVGISGTETKYFGTFNVFQAPGSDKLINSGGGQNQSSPYLAECRDAAGWTVKAQLSTTGDTPNHLTAGSCDFYLLVSQFA